jgi:hypothetical protein
VLGECGLPKTTMARELRLSGLSRSQVIGDGLLRKYAHGREPDHAGQSRCLGFDM